MHKKKIISPSDEKYLKMLNYLARFIILSMPIILIINMEFYNLQSFYAEINHALLNVFEINTTLFDSFSASGLSPSQYYNEKVIRIDSACTGIRSFYLLFAMLFAFRANLGKKFKYLLIGAFAIALCNILRILISSLLFFNGLAGFDSIVWAISLNITALIVVYFFIKNNSKNMLEMF
jgi:exosortase/archaeosortase family protein